MHAVQRGSNEVVVEDTSDAKTSSRNGLVYIYNCLKGTCAVCIRIHPVYLFIALRSAGVSAVG